MNGLMPKTFNVHAFHRLAKAFSYLPRSGSLGHVLDLCGVTRPWRRGEKRKRGNPQGHAQLSGHLPETGDQGIQGIQGRQSPEVSSLLSFGFLNFCYCVLYIS